MAEKGIAMYYVFQIVDVIAFVMMFFMLAVMNPIFIHSGETILFFMNDNPVTLEALIYGTCLLYTSDAADE